MFMSLILALFFVALVVAWSGKREMSIYLFSVFLLLSVAIFISHMTDIIGLAL